MKKNIIIWDNDGTIMGSKDPNDPTKTILPNVATTMNQPNTVNIICSGCKTAESELQNFNPDGLVKRLQSLMNTLPISAATFSPTIGGVECFVVIKKTDNSFEVRNAHEDPRYASYIGQFKKPGDGMLAVIKDLVREEFNLEINPDNSVMIGDTWHDHEAATGANIPFFGAHLIHDGKTLLTSSHITE
jgi:hypothetical protein